MSWSIRMVSFDTDLFFSSQSHNLKKFIIVFSSNNRSTMKFIFAAIALLASCASASTEVLKEVRLC
jgi:hypothetical protein